MAKTIVALLLSAGLLAPPMARAADVHVGINIGVPPPPPVVVESPPQLVIVPGTPVYYAPSLPCNYFSYGGLYYTFHDGHWFSAANYGGPWTFITVARVPRPVIAVPVRYYKVPPGHAKRHGSGHGHGHEEHGHGRGHEEHGHGHGHGHHGDD